MVRLRVFYDLNDAPSGHAQTMMRNLAIELGFTILASQPQSLFDGWEFWIEFEGRKIWPKHVRILSWADMPYQAPPII